MGEPVGGDDIRHGVILGRGAIIPNDTKSAMLLVSRPQSRRNNQKWQMQ
jgi:hypothetical protein